jgi:hypothetical protein
MAPDKIDESFLFNPHIIWDPGPEVYRMLGELSGDARAQALQAVLEAQAQIHEAKSAAYRKIGAAIGGIKSR